MNNRDSDEILGFQQQLAWSICSRSHYQSYIHQNINCLCQYICFRIHRQRSFPSKQDGLDSWQQPGWGALQRCSNNANPILRSQDFHSIRRLLAAGTVRCSCDSVVIFSMNQKRFRIISLSAPTLSLLTPFSYSMYLQGVWMKPYFCLVCKVVPDWLMI